ncbi:MAG: hypothetical protein J6P05_04705 [Lachnospiraceae bacterium]|nr:hypothetical protein [Lachnospiraceae bacterium]
MKLVYAHICRKVRIAAIFILAAVLAANLAGCGFWGKKEPEITETEEEDIPAEITQEDADQIVEDKLYDTKAKAVFSEVVNVDDENWYTYRVVNSDGEDLKEYVAVNAISGEVAVYDSEGGDIWDYSSFSLYDEKKDEPVSWDGNFVLGSMEVTLYPADDNAFEFNIKKNGEDQLAGVANVSAEKNVGIFKDEKVSLSFEKRDDSLVISDTGNMSGYAGVYEKKESEE